MSGFSRESVLLLGRGIGDSIFNVGTGLTGDALGSVWEFEFPSGPCPSWTDDPLTQHSVTFAKEDTRQQECGYGGSLPQAVAPVHLKRSGAFPRSSRHRLFDLAHVAGDGGEQLTCEAGEVHYLVDCSQLGVGRRCGSPKLFPHSFVCRGLEGAGGGVPGSRLVELFEVPDIPSAYSEQVVLFSSRRAVASKCCLNACEGVLISEADTSSTASLLLKLMTSSETPNIAATCFRVAARCAAASTVAFSEALSEVPSGTSFSMSSILVDRLLNSEGSAALVKRLQASSALLFRFARA